MADALATTDDLESYLQRPAGSIPRATGDLLIAAATAVVEAEIRQTLMQTTETITLLGSADEWLELPQRPVKSATDVFMDDIGLSDWKLVGNRLWRAAGWQRLSVYELRTITFEWLTGRFVRPPSQITVTYTHGYPFGDQHLELARQAVFMLAGVALANPTSEHSISIDDGRVDHIDALIGMALPASLAAALRRKYGTSRGGTVAPQ